MGEGQQAGVSVVDAPVRSGWSMALWGLVALLAHVMLLEAAVETFWSGSPLRWWLAPALVVFAVLSAWLWRPGGGLLARFGPATAAATPALAFLALLAITAWLPGGQESGLRLFLQPTTRLLTAALALAVLLAGVVLLRGVAALPPSPRTIARAAFSALALYALVSLGLGLRDNASFAGLLQGGALWQRLPRWLQGACVGGLLLLPCALLVQAVGLVGHLRRRQGIRVLLQQSTALGLVLVMVVSGVYLPSYPSSTVAAPVAETPSPSWARNLTPKERVDRLERLLQGVEALEKEVPTDTFSPDAIVAKLGTGVGPLAQWVRESTYWVPYRGALRGPTGVMMDRMGNALDRSWLLAELLRSAGHKVRLAHTVLTPDEAGNALSKMPPVPAQTIPRPARALDADLAQAVRYAETHQLDPASVREQLQVMARRSQQLGAELTRRVGVQGPFLAASVGRGGFVDERSRSSLAAIVDHWWVQVEEAGTWADIDVLLPDGQSPAPGRAPADTFVLDARGRLSLPKHYWQSVTVRARVEQWQAGRLSEHTTLEYSFHPAETFGQPLILQHMALDWPIRSNPFSNKAPMEEFKAAVLKQREWLPYLTVGDRQIIQSSFSDEGTLNQKPRVGQKQGPALGASDLFGGLLSEGPAPAAAGGVLTAEWIDYEIDVPGARPLTVRREVFDLLGVPRRRAGVASEPDIDPSLRLQRGVGLLGMTQVLPMACRLSPEFVQRQTLRELAVNRSSLTGIAAAIAAGSTNDVLQQAAKLKPTQVGLLDWALARFEWSPVAADVYVAAPNLISYRTVVLPEQGGALAIQQGFDVLANEVSVHLRAKSDAFSARVSQGAADTNAEGLLLPTRPAVNAGALDVGPARQPAWVTLRNSSDAAWKDVRWSPEVVGRMQADVQSGFVIVAPRGDGVATQCAWWRIDPRSGVTLGMGSSGWGEGAAERAILQMVIEAVAAFVVTFSLVFTVCAIRKGVLSNTYTDNMDERVAVLRDCSCAGLAGGAAVGGAVISGWAAWVIGMGIAGAAKEALCG